MPVEQTASGDYANETETAARAYNVDAEVSTAEPVSPAVLEPVEPTETTEQSPIQTAPLAVENDFQVGINLAGAEFGQPGGVYGQDYIYPDEENVAYYAERGLEIVRLPVLWERLQPTMNGPLDENELQRVDAVVDDAAARGMTVILDIHNYGYGYGAPIGSDATPNAAFADLWGKIAGHYRDDPNVVFGLMNEPHEQSPQEWLESSNEAIAAIRDAGASQQILVPGTAWSGAWSWTSSGNAEVLGNGIVDPADNYAFEVHQYLDHDGSGTNPGVESTTIGVERLEEVTAWAEEMDHELFLGEFGVADDPDSLQAMEEMLFYMQTHNEVWQGATYWAGGPWWGDYMFSAEPEDGNPSPQMEVLDLFT